MAVSRSSGRHGDALSLLRHGRSVPRQANQPRTDEERPDRLAGRLYNAAIVLGTPLEAPDDSAVLGRQQDGERARTGENETELGKENKEPTSFIEISRSRMPSTTRRFITYVRKLPVSRPEVDLINPGIENRLDFSRCERKWSAKWNGSLSPAANHGAIIRVFCFDRTLIVLVELQSEALCIHQWPGFIRSDKEESFARPANEQYGGMNVSITWPLLQIYTLPVSPLIFIFTFFARTHMLPEILH